VKRLITIIVTGALAFMLLLPNSSLAAEIKGGLKIGANSAKLYGDDVGELEDFLGEDWKSRIGFSVGGFITFDINEMFAIQSEVLYTMKGLRWEGEINGATPLKVWIKLDYLEIPVLVKIMPGTQGSIKPYLFAGPAVAIKVSGKVKAEFEGESDEEDLEDVKGTDFGLVIGAGVDFGFGASGKGKMTLDVRYTLGLSTISDFEGEDIKNGVFSLMVGYSF
jgi:hypothetical protein